MIEPQRPYSRLSSWLARFKGDSFVRSARVLIGGTAAAQLVGGLALPVLTRLYSADDFSILAIFVATLAIIGSVVCMQLDAAIPLPVDEDEALQLLVLALLSSIGVTLSLALVVWIWGQNIAYNLGHPEIAPYVWLLPIGAAVMGFYSALQYLAVRHKLFDLIARTRVTQALAGLGAQIGLGLAAIAPLGLLIGHAILSGVGVFALARRTLKSKSLREAIGMREGLLATLRRYKRFPQLSAAENLTNNAGIQVPILLIGINLVGPEAGYLFLAMRILGMPMAVIGGAFAQVYYANSSEYLREGHLAAKTEQMVQRLSIWIVTPLVFVAPFAPNLFHLVFGPEWERAGTLLVWLLPWYALQLLVSPVSMIMYTRNLQHVLLGFALLGLLIRVLPLGLILNMAPQYATLTYAASSVLYYLILLFVVLIAAQINFVKAIRIIALNSMLWITIATTSFFIISISNL
jgi:O-antigen/teichoic acid export membrane protein